MDFWRTKFTLKARIWHFLFVHILNFSLFMLILGKKSCFLGPRSLKFYNRTDIKLYIPGVQTIFFWSFSLHCCRDVFFTWIVVLIFKCRKHDLCDLHAKIQPTKLLNIISSFFEISYHIWCLKSLFSKV